MYAQESQSDLWVTDSSTNLPKRWRYLLPSTAVGAGGKYVWKSMQLLRWPSVWRGDIIHRFESPLFCLRQRNFCDCVSSQLGRLGDTFFAPRHEVMNFSGAVWRKERYPKLSSLLDIYPKKSYAGSKKRVSVTIFECFCDRGVLSGHTHIRYTFSYPAHVPSPVPVIDLGVCVLLYMCFLLPALDILYICVCMCGDRLVHARGMPTRHLFGHSMPFCSLFLSSLHCFMSLMPVYTQ